jgi:2-polyprenyl-3-methyl-5-hydroxy-6-metoxy-1,4-benzoquinol methylase
MPQFSPGADFPEHADENRRLWDANAAWWDEQIGDGNDIQDLLIAPASERLLAVHPGDTILDIACGAGRFSRRLAELGARVTAFDHSEAFLERARQRTPDSATIEYRVCDAADRDALLALGSRSFDKAVCTMALMDMPVIETLVQTLPVLLAPGGAFVFSVLHPCFHSAAVRMFSEMSEDEAGRFIVQNGVRVTAYRTPVVRKTEGIRGQPEAQYVFHRPLQTLLGAGFRAGFVVDGLEEPCLPPAEAARPGLRWADMPEIPPVLVVRMSLAGSGRPAARGTDRTAATG